MQSFDLIVIGTGSAGKTVAQTVRQAGRTVAIIDKLPFGGTCSQHGCDPKKVLVGAAEIIARSGQMTGKGIADAPTLNWPDLMAFKKTFTESVPKRTEDDLAKADIATFHGAARFVGPDTLRVGDDTLRADHIVIATGHRPRPLDIPGEELLIDSTGFLELPDLPPQIVMVGGGYIALEFAHIAARAGAKVTIVHRGKLPLEGFDPDLVKLLVKALEATGIRFMLEATVTEISGIAGDLTVHYDQHGQSQTVATQLAVHAAGRVADIAELNLDKAGVDTGKKGVLVNEYLQSVSNPVIYACGDVADKGLPLTPLAGYEGRIVAHNLLNGNGQTFAKDPVPTVVFTVPPLASVGLTEERARQQKRRVKVKFAETTDWYSSRRINEAVSGFKTLVDEETDQIVGAHLLGSGSEEVINLIALAMKHHLPANALTDVRFAYPTHGSDLSSMLPD